MIASVKYVLQENIKNFYRTFSIAKYELLADMHDSKLGIFWNYASPAIQVFTYWFAFGYIFNRKSVGDIVYMPWMLGGMVVWFFISPCITEGCSSIYYKIDVINKMKFPVSILPLSVVLKKLFNHLCLMCILVVVFAIYGYYPEIEWFGLLYYMLAAVLFSTSLALVTSVLTMLARDTRKFVSSIIRLLFYFTPILWSPDNLPDWLQGVISCNPIYYIVQGYRDCFFYHQGIGAYGWSMAWFWGITVALFLAGSYLMNKFKTRFIDMI